MVPETSNGETGTAGCLGHARWDDKTQATFVADGLEAEFGTVWQVVPHDDHFHVIDRGRTR